MEIVHELSNLIGTLGFPIVMCVYLLHQMEKQDDRHTHEIDALRQSLDNNTNVMTRILARIGED